MNNQRYRLIAAEFVRPYRKNERVKNDTRDAEAVLTALHAPGMRFVTIKTEEQQQRLAWHRLREGWKAERTALFNRIRGLLTEFGLVVELGATKIGFTPFRVEPPRRHNCSRRALRAPPPLAPPPRAGKSSPPDGLGSWPQTAATSTKPLSVLAFRTL